MTTVEEGIVYGVAVRSKFALFDEDDAWAEEPEQLLSKIESQQVKKEKEPKGKKGDQKSSKASTVKDDEKKSQNKEPLKPDNRHEIRSQQQSKQGTNTNEKPPRFNRPQRSAENGPRGGDEISEDSSRPQLDGQGSGVPRERVVGRGGGGRGGFSRGGRAPVNTTTIDEPGFSLDAPTDGRDEGRVFHVRGRGGPRGNMRGGRGAVRGTGLPGGPRDYDRHSGSDKTGVKPIEKRDGGGARNWGTVKDDLEASLHPPEGEAAAGSGDDANLVPVAVAATDGVDQTGAEESAGGSKLPGEDAVQFMTLAEYKKMREVQGRGTVVAKGQSEGGSGARQANDGVDPFINMVAHRKQRREDDDSDQDSIDAAEFEEERKKQNVLKIDIRFNDNSAGRRGRGRGRGAAAASAGPPGAANSRQPKTGDEQQGVPRPAESQAVRSAQELAKEFDFSNDNEFPTLK